MQNQRSKGVTIFAWSIIAVSFLNLLSRLEFLFRSFSKGTQVSVSGYFYLVISVISIIAGIYLLKLKNWARLVTIIISIIVFVDICIKVPPIVKNIAVGPAFFILLLFILIPLLFEAGVVYYFTRSKVLEQFSCK